jgi:hypothetical protein
VAAWIGAIAVVLAAVLAAAIGIFGDRTETPTTRTEAVLLTNEISDVPGNRGAFCTIRLSMQWHGGLLVLSGNRDGSGVIEVDDAVRIQNPNGATLFYQDFSDKAANKIAPKEPLNIASIAKPGANEFVVRLENVGGRYRSSAVWLVGNFSNPSVKECEG